jgi:plasmid stabilization system protein ParE
MAFKVIIKPLAYEDLDAAINCYESQQKGLGVRFLQSFEISINKIGNHPLHYATYYKNVRRHLLKIFPYKIFYLVVDDKVYVLGIYHGKRSNRFINKRLKLL